MKLATVRTNNTTTAARLDDDTFGDGTTATCLDFADVGALLNSNDWRTTAATATGERLAVEALDFAPVVPNPTKVICVGKNYRDHIEEMGSQVPEYPTLFTKFADSLIGADDPIPVPPESRKVDWEVELCIVIGTTARRAQGQDAIDAIAGYTVMNDVSMRDFQFHTSQFAAGKMWQSSTPVGPWLEVIGGTGASTGASLAHPSLDLSTDIDGTQMQSGNTSNMVFDPVALVEYISTIVTLHPGDLIATGTPGGVGAGRSPEVYLQPGQTVTTRVEGIGECVNLVIAETA